PRSVSPVADQEKSQQGPVKRAPEPLFFVSPKPPQRRRLHRAPIDRCIEKSLETSAGGSSPAAWRRNLATRQARREACAPTRGVVGQSCGARRETSAQ